MDKDFRIKEGDIYILNKNHSCGSNKFKVLKSGIDTEIECLNCGHKITIDRLKLRQSIKKIVKCE